MTTFLKFWHMGSFWPPKCQNFGHFHQKWPILIKFTPLMTFLTKIMSINPISPKIASKILNLRILVYNLNTHLFMKNKDHAVSLESYKDHSKYQHNGASTIIYHFGENGPNWVILGAKITTYVKTWGICLIIFCL